LFSGAIEQRSGISASDAMAFSLMLPYANLFWTRVLTVIVGLVLASAFPAILVYAQELVPGRVGMISGLFFGFAFGMGGIGAASWAESPTLPAFSLFTKSVRGFPQSDCWRGFYLIRGAMQANSI
jgi:MFS family permease